MQVVHAHLRQELQRLADLRVRREQLDGLADGELEHVGDALAFVAHGERGGVEAPALALLALHVDVGEEVHFDLAHAVAFAGLAAPALHVEREAPGLEAVHAGLGQLGEEAADLVEDLDVRRWVAARCATDGLLARAIQVQRVLPGFSGAQVDNAVDVLTFIWAPIFIMGHENLLPHPFWLAVPVLAALYAYGQVNMKTPDNFFLGFPSYWNIVAMYLYWFRPGPVTAVLMVVIPGIFSFIPTRYLYPSRNSAYWKPSWILGSVWTVLLVFLLLQADPSLAWVWVSLYYPVYYLVVSFYLDWNIRQTQKEV